MHQHSQIGTFSLTHMVWGVGNPWAISLSLCFSQDKMIFQQLEDRATFIESHSNRVKSSKWSYLCAGGLGQQPEDTTPALFILCDHNLINSWIVTAPTPFSSCINSKFFWLPVKSKPGQNTPIEETQGAEFL